MDKKTKKSRSIVNRDIVVMWMFAATWGFLLYLYFGFQPIGNWIWKNRIYANFPDKILNPSIFVTNSVSLLHLILWILIFSFIYIVALSLLVILPSYLYLRHKRQVEVEQEKTKGKSHYYSIIF